MHQFYCTCLFGSQKIMGRIVKKCELQFVWLQHNAHMCKCCTSGVFQLHQSVLTPLDVAVEIYFDWREYLCMYCSSFNRDMNGAPWTRYKEVQWTTYGSIVDCDRLISSHAAPSVVGCMLWVVRVTQIQYFFNLLLFCMKSTMITSTTTPTNSGQYNGNHDSF